MRPHFLATAIAILAAPTTFAAELVPSVSGRPGCFHANPASEQAIGYCKAIRTGNVLYISGQPGHGPMPDAIKSVYENLKQTLAAHGLSFADVVKETVFATDLDAFSKDRELRKAYYGSVLPSASWVEVRRLLRPSFVLEVELVAVFPPGK
jgi:enamine deaminase RidA (YjgF/YER057c/UK114 family)